MHTIIHPVTNSSRKVSAAPTSVEAFRQPSYDCREHVDAMKLVVYVPGVGASGIEIEARGADLTVTARKQHFVRVNWQALHLENAQRDYQLRLRLGHGFDYAAMEAEVRDGVLTITLPKRAADFDRLRRVA
ncbi:MAG TPA: Hsp20/alpha crystallin family protein [Opitutaceae bacterium]|nr:Hsp20/alpha crystallin family protein [Opitutaceae bacterium]